MKGEPLTVDQLIDALGEIKTMSPQFGQYKVMMRHDLDGDVVLGAHITKTEVDGLHQHVNLIGPVKDRKEK